MVRPKANTLLRHKIKRIYTTQEKLFLEKATPNKMKKVLQYLRMPLGCSTVGFSFCLAPHLRETILFFTSKYHTPWIT